MDVVDRFEDAELRRWASWAGSCICLRVEEEQPVDLGDWFWDLDLDLDLGLKRPMVGWLRRGYL